MTKSMDTTVKYHATFELDPSGHWLVEVEEIPQVHSFGRTLGKAREYLLDALALWLDEPVDKLTGQVAFRSPTLPSDVQETVDMAIAERQIAEAATRVAADLTARASAGLVQDAHLSMRDAADILGLSHQRVQQLLAVGQGANQRMPEPISETIEGLSRSLREYFPGGSKEDLGALAAAVAIALGVVWVQSK
jgi:predicted RNase H-like HicB family nuclease